MKELISIMLLAFIFCSCSRIHPKEHKVQPIRVSVQQISKDQDQAIHNYVGSLESEINIPIRFTLGGTLTNVYVHNGQTVKKGAIIAKVDDTSARSIHDAALATLRQAEDGYERLSKVKKEGGVSEVRWVQMETDLEKARQSEISARKYLEECTAYAPIDGVISGAEQVVGSSLRPLEVFANLIDITKMGISFSVPEKDINNISIGDMAQATLPALGNKVIPIKISDKSLVANPMGHTYTVQARITGNTSDYKLMPGMVAKIKMNATGNTGIFVPANCIQTMANGIVLWCVDKDSIVSRRYITIGEYVKNGVLVVDGLEENDIVVTEGYQKLYTGAKVTY